MRLDKYLKVSRLIKRRTLANEACQKGKVLVNDKTAKPGYELKVDDVITIQIAKQPVSVKVLQLKPHVRKEEAKELYQILS